MFGSARIKKIQRKLEHDKVSGSTWSSCRTLNLRSSLLEVRVAARKKYANISNNVALAFCWTEFKTDQAALDNMHDRCYSLVRVLEEIGWTRILSLVEPNLWIKLLRVSRKRTVQNTTQKSVHVRSARTTYTSNEHCAMLSSVNHLNFTVKAFVPFRRLHFLVENFQIEDFYVTNSSLLPNGCARCHAESERWMRRNPNEARERNKFS